MDVRTKGVATYNAYFALGDSYSSGRGTGSEVDACGHSSQAWPYMVTQSWEPVATLLACGGSRIVDIYNSQLPQVPNGPELITIVIGGDDVGDPQTGIASFGNEANHCFQTDCTPDESELASSIDGLLVPLEGLFTTIRDQAPGADIVVSGYPWLMRPPDESICSIWFDNGVPGFGNGFSGPEKLMMRRLAARLDGVISAAASFSGVVDATGNVVAEFEGPGYDGLHDACAPGPDEFINEIAVTDWNPFHFKAENTLHPNVGGQFAYALGINATRNTVIANGAVR